MNEPGNHSTSQAKKPGLLVLLVTATLLLISFGLESLRYLRPVTIKTGRHAAGVRRLPDGTIVMLDSASQVALGSEWEEGGSREVWLQGGALFNTAGARDTAGLAIHLAGFDVVACNNTSIYCFNRKKRMYAWLKGGRAFVVTHGTKPKKLIFLPGNVVDYTHLQFLTGTNTNLPALSPAN